MAWVIFTADHEYFALAMNEASRDAYLLELAMYDHREGYAEPYENLIKPECRVDPATRDRQIAESLRQSKLEAARMRGDQTMIALLEEAEERMAAE